MEYFNYVVNLNHEGSCCCILHIAQIEKSSSELLTTNSMSGLGDILARSLFGGLIVPQIVSIKIVPNTSELKEM